MKSLKLKYWLIASGLFCGSYAFSQAKHTVESKETIYGISKKYGITQDDLLRANPNIVTNGLKVGDVLTIPGVSSNNQNNATVSSNLPEVYVPKEDGQYTYIQIEAKQTVYGLSKKYKISENQLLSLNPQLKEGLKIGDVIRIPKQTSDNSTANSQTQTLENIPGKHLVKKGDSVYGIAKQYKVSEQDLYASNPDLQSNGLKIDSYLTIPTKKLDTQIEHGFIEYKVKSGDSTYGIMKQYHISFSDLLNNNPELSNGLQDGMVLKIPLVKDAKINLGNNADAKTLTATTGKINHVKDETIDVLFLLPYMYADGSGNSLTSIATDFVSGAKMALEKWAKAGKKINLKIVDSSNTDSAIEDFVKSYDFSKTDLIVGPLFSNNLEVLANALKDSDIPIVSPFANSEDIQKYSNVLISNTEDSNLVDAIVSEMKKKYGGEDVYLLTDDNNMKLAEYAKSKIEDQLDGAHVTLTTDVNKIVQPTEKISETLENGTKVNQDYATPIVTLLVSSDNNLGKKYIDKLLTFDSDFLNAYAVNYVASYDIYSTKNKETIEGLKKIGFTFVTPKLVDLTSTEEIDIINEYRKKYCEVPNDYSQAGYDILNDLVRRMDAQGNLFNNLSKLNEGFATNYSYEKIKGQKAYENKAVKVIVIE